MNDKELISQLTKHLTLAIDHIEKLEEGIEDSHAEVWDFVEDSYFNWKEAITLLEGLS